MNSVAAVELIDVTKDYSIGVSGMRLRAVDGLSLKISGGQIFGLLGPNGSGKSTTIKMLLGFLRPTKGCCLLFGRSSDHPASRVSVGYLPESPDFYRYLTARELVAFYAQLSGIRRPGLESRVDDVIAAVGLTHARDRQIGSFSKGMLQRIGIAQAIVHDPELLILDEPTAGVDPVAAGVIGQLLRQLKAAGKTIVITSHLLGEMEALCDRVAILAQGRLKVEGSVERLTAGGGSPGLMVKAMTSEERAKLDTWLITNGHTASTAAAGRQSLADVFHEHVNSERADLSPLT